MADKLTNLLCLQMSPEDQMELENKIEDVCWLICKTPYIGKKCFVFSFLQYESENQSNVSRMFLPFLKKYPPKLLLKKCSKLSQVYTVRTRNIWNRKTTLKQYLKCIRCCKQVINSFASSLKICTADL